VNSGRKNIMLGTAGHVDHGKSALVRLLTGCETDTLEEEKQRGLTIDLGFAPCKLGEEGIVGIVDVPGHVDFIRNMVAGAHGIDLVMFVVAADDGIMPQTLEHLQILSLMGLRHGLIALTKIDLVSEVRRSEVVADLKRLLGGTFLESAPVCPVSNVTGDGYDNFFDILQRVARSCGGRDANGIFRVYVEDVFSIRGAGTIITGIPSSGSVRLGDALELLPTRATGRVRQLQVYGKQDSEARAGECVALNLPEFDHTAVRRGMVLCAPGILDPVTMAEGELHLLNSVPAPLKDYFEAHLHVGTAATTTHVAMLDTTQMAPGSSQMVQLRFADPLALAPGDRFVLRANLPSQAGGGLATIGGGRILSTTNTRLRRHKPWTLETLARRADAIGKTETWLANLLREGARPLTLAQIARQSLVRIDDAQPMLDRLTKEQRVYHTENGSYVHREVIDSLMGKISATVEQFHATNPQRNGISKPDLLQAVRADEECFGFASRRLLDAGRIAWNGTVFSRPGWVARISGTDEQVCETLEGLFRNAGWTPPSLPELGAKVSASPGLIDRNLRLLVERGLLIQLDEKTIMHTSAIESAKTIALRLFARAPSFTTMDFRDALNVSRKYAVPLIDYLDRVRFTVRSGHNRTPGVEARKRMTAPAGASSIIGANRTTKATNPSHP
jgi:selenocysteine-specific elongation factor